MINERLAQILRKENIAAGREIGIPEENIFFLGYDDGMLENCCYDFFELLTLNMSRQGFYGELTHAGEGYIHSYAPSSQPRKYEYADKWRKEQVQGIKGNCYPTDRYTRF